MLQGKERRPDERGMQLKDPAFSSVTPYAPGEDHDFNVITDEPIDKATRSAVEGDA